MREHGAKEMAGWDLGFHYWNSEGPVLVDILTPASPQHHPQNTKSPHIWRSCLCHTSQWTPGFSHSLGLLCGEIQASAALDSWVFQALLAWTESCHFPNLGIPRHTHRTQTFYLAFPSERWNSLSSCQIPLNAVVNLKKTLYLSMLLQKEETQTVT